MNKVPSYRLISGGVALVKFLSILMIMLATVILFIPGLEAGLELTKPATGGQLVTAYFAHVPLVALGLGLLFNAGIVGLLANVALAIRDIAQNTAHLKP